jgi:Tol biopolymer transport system component
MNKKIVVICVCLFLMATMLGTSIALAKKPGGGGKPPEEPPADPAIVYRTPKGRDTALMVMNADGSNQAVIYQADTIGNPCWAPDGSAIAFLLLQEDYTEDLYRIDVSVVNGVPMGSNPTELAQDIEMEIEWSPSGDVIAFENTVNGYKVLQTVPATGGTIETIYTAQEGYGIGSFAWSNDASKMAIGSGSNGVGSLLILDLSDGTITTVSGPSTDSKGHFDWARTSDTLVCTSKAGISTIDLTSPSPTWETLIAGEGLYKMPTWSPDDSQIACLKWDKNNWLNIMVYTIETEEMEKIAKGFAPDWCRE